jgi:hypothetical protein
MKVHSSREFIFILQEKKHLSLSKLNISLALLFLRDLKMLCILSFSFLQKIDKVDSLFALSFFAK